MTDENSTVSVEVLGSTINIDVNSASTNTTANCSCPCPADDITTSSNAYSYDALLYIIVVLSFYAMSMVLLMIKYIRREEEEISLDFYYTEFVKREKFRTANFKNSLALQKVSNVDMLEKMANSKTDARDLRPFDGALFSEEETKVSVVTEGLSTQTEPGIMKKEQAHCSVSDVAMVTDTKSTRVHQKKLEKKRPYNYTSDSDAIYSQFGTRV